MKVRGRGRGMPRPYDGEPVVRLFLSRQGRTFCTMSRLGSRVRTGVETGYRWPVLPLLTARANLLAGMMRVVRRESDPHEYGENVR